MTNFEQAVAQYCKGLDSVYVGCLGEKCEYADGDLEHQCEAYFSRVQCDSCGSTLAGMRVPAYGRWYDDDDVLVHISMEICVDCVMYHVNGEVSDNER